MLISTGSHIPLAIHRTSHPPPSRHIAEHRSSIAHNVRYIAIATWEDWIVGRGAEGMDSREFGIEGSTEIGFLWVRKVGLRLDIHRGNCRVGDGD